LHEHERTKHEKLTLMENFKIYRLLPVSGSCIIFIHSFFLINTQGVSFYSAIFFFSFFFDRRYVTLLANKKQRRRKFLTIVTFSIFRNVEMIGFGPFYSFFQLFTSSMSHIHIYSTWSGYWEIENRRVASKSIYLLLISLRTKMKAKKKCKMS
jgi:hypothetical protein